MDEYRSTPSWPYSIAAGGAVYRDGEQGREYAILYRLQESGDKSWHLPKGTLGKGEPLEDCALREIREESGLEAGIQAYLGSLHSRYEWKGMTHDTARHYFLCKFQSEVQTQDNEHDGLEWLPVNIAMERLALQPKQEEEIISRAEHYFAIR